MKMDVTRITRRKREEHREAQEAPRHFGVSHRSTQYLLKIMDKILWYSIETVLYCLVYFQNIFDG